MERFPDVAAESPQPAIPPAAPAPRFGLAHLLLWVGCCGAYFAVVRKLADREPGAVGVLVVILLAAGTGAAWTVLLVFISRRVRGVRWPLEPGEWLAAVLGARLALDVLLKLWPLEVLRSPRALLAAVTCVLLVLPTLSRKLPGIWKLFFGLLVLVTAGPLVVVCLEIWLVPAGALSERLLATARWLARNEWALAAGLAALVALVDRCRGGRHGWLHWAGLGVWLWTAAAALLVGWLG